MALNFYRLLGVPPDSGQRKIKTAYRELAKRFHPDRNKGSETAAELFRQVNHAYKVLSDSKLRGEYDRQLAQQEVAQSSSSKKNAQLDPQQKFSRFISSLLDAMFGTNESPVKSNLKTTPPKSKHKTARREKPAFNFHYNLAVENKRTPYSRGNDGVFRKSRPPQRQR